MKNKLNVGQINVIDEHRDELSQLLVDVVADGASIGFLPPLRVEEAASYWAGVLEPHVLLFIARLNGATVGSVQLQLCNKENGRHRAEIAKLMTAPEHRRQGIGRALMQMAEQYAKQGGRTLIVLDTRDGDPSNALYTSLGYKLAGSIQAYAQSADGELHATNIYYKMLNG